MSFPIIYFGGVALIAGSFISRRFRKFISVVVIGGTAFALFFLTCWGLL